MTTDRRRFAALLVLCAGMLMIVLDITIVNVALPAIRDDLGFSEASLAWVVNAYMIAFGGLLLLAGRLVDLLGRRRVFVAGLSVFTVASLACGLAQNEAWLVAARFVQGAGGALTSAVILGMIVTMFPEPREQARAIGAYAFVASAGGAVGLLAGGSLTQAISWHWIFFVNIPIGILTAVLALRVLDGERGIGLGAGTDVLGAATVTAALMLGVYTIVGQAAVHGWTAASTLWLGAASVALLVLFVVRELVAANPLVPMNIFRSRNVVGANLIQIAGGAGMFGTFFLGSLYLKGVLDYSAMEIGLAFLPTTIGMATMSIRFTEPLVSRYGARPVMIAGLVLIAAGLAEFAFAPVHANYWAHVFPVVTLLGVGAGLTFPALMTLAMSGVRPAEAGLASGLVNTTGQVGCALGLAVLAALSTARTSALTERGESIKTALTDGYHLAFWVAAAVVLVAVVIARTVLHPADQPTTDDASEQDEVAAPALECV
jgi:EmrB/QacA subfamily drug resistance transporter